MYLVRDTNDPTIVWVKPDRVSRPWFCFDPVRGQIRIKLQERRETLDIDEMQRAALALVLPIDNAGDV